MHIRSLLVACVLFAGAPVAMFAQAQAGSRIFGTITDPSGSPIPAAEVRIKSTTTGAETVAVTSSDGNYVAPQVSAGTYNIEVSKTGFSTASATGVTVRTNESVRRNIEMTVGTVSTTVEVSASAELTNTYTAQLSQTVDSRRVRELPLNGRDVTQLTLTVAGASVTDASTSFYAGTSGFDTTTAVVNGNRTQGNSYLLDGMGNQFMERRVSNVYPNPDAVEEFTLNTSQYSAEMGGNPGAQLSARTKSGTNELHGSLFEFLRNGNLNARNAFDQSGKNDGLKRNQYGWAVGGPLYIPKIIDGRNRFFWFNSYQSTPVRQPGTPGFHESWTRREKDGDFSEHLRAQTRQVPSPACDGSTQTVNVGTIFDPNSANNACGSLGLPFAGNIIPRSRLDPVMQSILNKHTPDSPFVGYLIPHFIPAAKDEWQLVNKGDAIIGKHALMGRYIYSKKAGGSFNDEKDLLWNVGINDGGNTTEAITWAVTDTWTVSPTILVTGGFAFLKNPFSLTPHPYLTAWSSHGSSIPNDPGCQDLNFSVAGRGGIRVWDRCSTKDTHSWEINSAVKWVRDKHDISVGVMYSQHHNSAEPQKQSGGGFTFGDSFTGISAADAVLGRALTYTAGNFGPITEGGSVRTLAALYFQDNFRISRKLTLNFGLRWDPGHHSKNKFGPNGRYQSWIIPGQQSVRFRNAPPGILYHGDPGTPDASGFTRWNQFAPRLGFAYDPSGSGKWAIRGGIGGYFGQFQAGGFALGGAGSGAPPLPSGGASVVNPPNLSSPWDGAPFNGRIGIPVPEPTVDSPVPVPLPSQWAYDPRTKNPNTWNWSLTVERNMGGDVLLRGSYVASRGTHLIGGYEQNLATYIPGASTLGNIQQRRPDPNFQAINVSSGVADSYYHSLQVTAEKRYSKGLTFQANYTLSKSIDTGSNDIGWSGAFGNQDPRGPWFNRGLSEFDRTHVVNASVVWDSPKLATPNPVLRQLGSNWQMSGLVFLRSGNPFTPVSSRGNSFSPGHSSVDRADLVPGQDWRVGDRGRHEIINVGYFNQAAFTDPALGTRGNVGRSVMRGPGYASTDLMLARLFPIKESLRVQFRAEFFNFFNRVNFNTVAGNGSPAFSNVSNPNFGKFAVVGAQSPRILQFGLKVLF
ncbi:MAG: carboxypeptidase-like regulatory domain-containing protein [Bryobacteraceae bacterium]